MSAKGPADARYDTANRPLDFNSVGGDVWVTLLGWSDGANRHGR